MGKEGRITGRQKYLPALFVILGTILFVNLFSPADYNVFSLLIGFDVKLGYSGGTHFILPPIGKISAKTHFLPIEIRVTLKNIDLSVLRKVVFSSPEGLQSVLTVVQGQGRKVLLFYISRLIILGYMGAVGGLFVLGQRNAGKLALQGLTGALVVVFFVGATYFTYNVRAFERPEYEGIIEAAPWMLNVVQESLGRVEELGERIQAAARNLYSVFNQLEGLGPVGLVEADVVVLHVSDIHNNPVAYDFACQVIRSFPVNFVLDTGDLTDWGTALEAEICKRISEIDVPYVFTSGNHESPQVLERLEEIQNVVLVEQGEVVLNGLRIVGIGDKAAASHSPASAPLSELEAVAAGINEYWKDIESRPDIFMVHNHRVARKINPGLFPVVVYGHNHVLEQEQIDGTVYINAGTTGATGIRGFQSAEPLPYSLSLLYFSYDDAENLSLVAVDGVHVTGLGASFSLQRTFIDYGRNQVDDVEIVDDILW